MIEKPDFEQKDYSRTCQGVYKTGHESFKKMKWLFHYARSYYDSINYYDLIGSFLKFTNEVSQR